MSKITIVAIFMVAVIIQFGCHTSKPATKSAGSSVNSQASILDSGKPAIEDVLLKEFDTANWQQYVKELEISPDSIAYLRKFFVKDICRPNDQKNARYTNYIKTANKEIDSVKIELKRRLEGPVDKLGTRDREFLNRINGIQNLNNCIFQPMLVYYLTYNVAEIKEGGSVLNYFNLDDNVKNLKYLVFLDNKHVGFVKYTIADIPAQNVSYRSCSPTDFFLEDSGSYSIAARHSSKPIALLTTIPFDGIMTVKNFNRFGFVEGADIRECFYSEGTSFSRETTSGKLTNTQNVKEENITSLNKLFFDIKYGNEKNNSIKLLEIIRRRLASN
ncbi:MAG: hypothetical protein QM791_06985 [Ferruginibacter sp.]